MKLPLFDFSFLNFLKPSSIKSYLPTEEIITKYTKTFEMAKEDLDALSKDMDAVFKDFDKVCKDFDTVISKHLKDKK